MNQNERFRFIDNLFNFIRSADYADQDSLLFDEIGNLNEADSIYIFQGLLMLAEDNIFPQADGIYIFFKFLAGLFDDNRPEFQQHANNYDGMLNQLFHQARRELSPDLCDNMRTNLVDVLEIQINEMGIEDLAPMTSLVIEYIINYEGDFSSIEDRNVLVNLEEGESIIIFAALLEYVRENTDQFMNIDVVRRFFELYQLLSNDLGEGFIEYTHNYYLTELLQIANNMDTPFLFNDNRLSEYVSWLQSPELTTLESEGVLVSCQDPTQDYDFQN